MMNTIVKWSSFLLTAFTMWSCVKTEALDLEKDYTAASAERSKIIAEQEAKAQAEAEAAAEKQWEAYYKMLTEYKQKAWKGEKPFVYSFFSGWVAVEGLNQTWLQSLPDSLSAVSIWGGFGKEPEEMTENQRFDLEMFHKKGSKVFTCYQVPNVGLGLPGGSTKFYEKYGNEKTADAEIQRSQIYARELARHIIALDFDGFDIDWEPTVGNHGGGYHEFAGRGAYSTRGYHDNMVTFIEELGKYFGAKYEGEQRKQYLRDLFDENFAGYHEKEKEFIQKYKPYFEKYNAVDKKFYLLFDGEFFRMTEELDKNFDKYIMQDYGRSDSFRTYLNSWTAGGSPSYYPPNTKVSSTAELEKGQYDWLINKAKNYKTRNGGVSSYKGEKDYSSTHEDVNFRDLYMVPNKIKFRKYRHFAWHREAIRIMDPRSDQEYAEYVETLPIIKTPKK